MPLGGVLLGVIFLNETLSWNLALGGLLIVISVIMVNRKTVKGNYSTHQIVVPVNYQNGDCHVAEKMLSP